MRQAWLRCLSIVRASDHEGPGCSCRRWSFGILMYELVYGFTPFRGAKRDQTFENILKRPLVFPPKPEISKPCQVCDTAHCFHFGCRCVHQASAHLHMLASLHMQTRGKPCTQFHSLTTLNP